MRRGFSLIELLIVVAIIGVLAAISIPSMLTAHMAANETAAHATLKTLHTLQAQYMAQFGRFAVSLTELGPPPDGADLIGKDLAAGRKSGYRFELRPHPAGYMLHSSPVVFGTTGRCTYYSDQTLRVHRNWGSSEPASPSSPEM